MASDSFPVGGVLKVTRLSVRFDTAEPRFEYSFRWEGDRTAAESLIAEDAAVACHFDLDLDDYLTVAVSHMPAILRSPEVANAPDVKHAHMRATLSFLLRQLTGHPEHPRRFLDHIDDFDLDFLITRVGGKIEWSASANAVEASAPPRNAAIRAVD